MRFLIFFAFYFCMGLAACHKHRTLAPIYLTTDRTTLSLDATGNGKDSFSVIANVAWTLSGLPQWARANITSGSGNQKIFVTANQANNSSTPLTATLSIGTTSGIVQAIAITLNQEGAQSTLTADSSSLTLEAATNSKDSFMVFSNTAWTITGLSQWVRFNGPTGIAVSRNGIIYVADHHNHTIRKITSQ